MAQVHQVSVEVVVVEVDDALAGQIIVRVLGRLLVVAGFLLGAAQRANEGYVRLPQEQLTCQRDGDARQQRSVLLLQSVEQRARQQWHEG